MDILSSVAARSTEALPQLDSLANYSLSMVPLTPNLEQDLIKTMMCRLHQNIYHHLCNCRMTKTAEAFLSESMFFPSLQSGSQVILEGMHTHLQETEGVPQFLDTLVQSWYLFYLHKQSQRSHTSQSPPTSQGKGFKCRFPGCNGSFTTFANMKRHEKLHTGEKSFVCSYEGCGRAFARKYDLKIHQRIHSKEKPFPCPVEGCTKAFSRQSSLREHQRSLHGPPQSLPSSPETHRPKRRRVESSSSDSDRSDVRDTHVDHFPGCGHQAVVHEGHADFLVPGADGVAELLHCHNGQLHLHSLPPLPSSSCPALPPEHENSHKETHVHGPDCGHPMVKHDDHVDYLVDNLLHHWHDGHCDHHGDLTLLNEGQEWTEFLDCTWDGCPKHSSENSSPDNNKSRSPPSKKKS